jgi:triosephosphate isomerase (TIM)
VAARTPVFAGNWKMNTTVDEGTTLCRELRERLDGELRAEIILCPPFTHLVPLHDCLAGSTLFGGAQDLYWEAKGAYTGEVSAAMLQGLVSHVIIGHSERRTYFGETDLDVNRKVAAALQAGLIPIVCIGETGEQRSSGQTQDVLRRQISEGLGDADLAAGVIVAYEPVWAIGTGVSANGQQAEETILFIRSQLHELSGSDAEGMPILYGGSVTTANIAEFMSEADIDGALVGGASLSAASFAEIVKSGLAAALTRSSTRS